MNKEKFNEFKNGTKFCKKCGRLVIGNICLNCVWDADEIKFREGLL